MKRVVAVLLVLVMVCGAVGAYAGDYSALFEAMFAEMNEYMNRSEETKSYAAAYYDKWKALDESIALTESEKLLYAAYAQAAYTLHGLYTVESMHFLYQGEDTGVDISKVGFDASVLISNSMWDLYNAYVEDGKDWATIKDSIKKIMVTAFEQK